MKRFLYAVVTLLTPALLLAGYGLFFASGDRLRPVVEWAASAARGGAVKIGGLRIDRGRVTVVEATDVTVADPNRPDGSPMVRLSEARVAFVVTSLFDGRYAFEAVELAGAGVTVTAGAAGPSAQSDGDAAAAGEAPQIALPIIRRIEVVDLEIVYQTIAGGDAPTTVFDVSVDRAEGRMTEANGLSLTGAGTYRDREMTFDIAAGDVAEFAQGGETPIEASVEGALDLDASFTVNGDGAVSPIAFQASGESLGAIRPFVPTPLPETKPFALSGVVELQGGGYSATELDGRIGESDFAGAVDISFSDGTPRVTGELRSSTLVFDDIAGLIGATPAGVASDDAGGGSLIPDAPVPVAALRAVEIDLRYVADAVRSPIAQVEAIDAAVSLQRDRLLIKPFTLGLAGGGAEGEVAVNLREDTPSADIDLSFNDVSLATFFSGSAFAEEMGGRLSGDLYALGVGQSLKDMIATARGAAHVFLADGSVSALLVEGAGLDVAEALGVVLSGDQPVAMPCFGAALSVEDGRVAIRIAEASTTDSLIRATGSADLDGLRYDLRVKARARDFSLLDFNAPVTVSGRADDFEVSVGGEGPQLFTEGAGDQTSCDSLRERVRAAIDDAAE